MPPPALTARLRCVDAVVLLQHSGARPGNRQGQLVRGMLCALVPGVARAFAHALCRGMLLTTCPMLSCCRAKPLGGPDAWNAACLFGNNPNSCPDLGVSAAARKCCTRRAVCAALLSDHHHGNPLLPPQSPDYDFGQAPMLVNACRRGTCRQLVVAGQKSGWVWALDPQQGNITWSCQVGPGGLIGGLQWGSASDGARIYVSNNNYNAVDFSLAGMRAVPNTPGATTAPARTNGGLAAALDAFDGRIVWTFANPLVHWTDVGVTDGSAVRAKSQVRTRAWISSRRVACLSE